MTTLTGEQLAIPDRLLTPQHRAAEIEHIDPDEGTILVRVAPYNHEIRLDRDLWETFDTAAFAAASKAPHRVKMWHNHDGPLIGHALEVTDRPDGSWALGKFSNTAAANEARELARDGTLDQVSVTFSPSRDWMRAERRSDGLHVRHSRAYMLGFALVPHGAYGDGAYVASVRDLDQGTDEQRAAERADRLRLERRQRLENLTH